MVTFISDTMETENQVRNDSNKFFLLKLNKISNNFKQAQVNITFIVHSLEKNSSTGIEIYIKISFSGSTS